MKIYKCDNPDCNSNAQYWIGYGEENDLKDGDYSCIPCMDDLMISDGSLIKSIHLLRDNVSLVDTPDTLYEYVNTDTENENIPFGVV